MTWCWTAGPPVSSLSRCLKSKTCRAHHPAIVPCVPLPYSAKHSQSAETRRRLTGRTRLTGGSSLTFQPLSAAGRISRTRRRLTAQIRWIMAKPAGRSRKRVEESPEPAGGSESWPRPGIAGRRPLAGDGASRRPKGVSKSEVVPSTSLSGEVGGSFDYGVAGRRLRSG